MCLLHVLMCKTYVQESKLYLLSSHNGTQGSWYFSANIFQEQNFENHTSTNAIRDYSGHRVVMRHCLFSIGSAVALPVLVVMSPRNAVLPWRGYVLSLALHYHRPHILSGDYFCEAHVIHNKMKGLHLSFDISHYYPIIMWI